MNLEPRTNILIQITGEEQMIDYHIPNNKIWSLPFLPPIAEQVKGIDTPQECLSTRISGEWKFLFNQIQQIPSPYDKMQDYDFSSVSSGWQDVIVPASLTMQGFDIRNNVEYYYKRNISVDKDALGQGLRAFLRFEGVYSNCRVWVNNRYVSTHIGGFTPFVVELTDIISSVQSCEIVVGVSDIEGKDFGIWNSTGKPVSDASWASYYAHNNICGILRDVTLFYLPKDFILSNRTSCGLTDDYTDGKLNIDMLLVSSQDLQLKIDLEDSTGDTVYDKVVNIGKEYIIDKSLYTQAYSFDFENFDYSSNSASQSDKEYSKDYVHFQRCQLGGNLYGFSFSDIISNVNSWTAENPKLYRLSLTLMQEETLLCRYDQKVGFRRIEYGGINAKDVNKLYVNGQQVKLRGVCRHDVSYQYGRSLSKAEELEEILSYKRNNVNHVRTSHYPASKNFIELCDMYGIYVELENAVCFKGSNGYKMHCSAEQIIQNLSEMIEFYYNHPSILIWSIGNESGFEKSAAFRLSYNYIKEQDMGRPVIFSYPFTVKTKPLPYDIYSKHYHKVYLDTGRKDMPKLHDEFAHVACYNIEDISRDNNYRLAWGESIKMGWERIYYDDGALGCAIWGGIDDVFFLPKPVSVIHQRHTASQALGYGEWGSILDVFKREKPEAYLTKKAFSPIVVSDIQVSDNGIIMYVSNRYDHTNINQVTCRVAVDENVLFDGELSMCNIPPRTKGKIEIPLNTYGYETINLAFCYDGYEIDREIVTNRRVIKHVDKIKSNSLRLNEEGGVVISNGVSEIVCNPHVYINSKKKKALSRKVYQTGKGEARKIVIKENYGCFKHATIRLGMSQCGKIEVNLDTSPCLNLMLGNHYGVGLSIESNVESVDWIKDTLYSHYPLEHLERPEGTAYRYAEHPNEYGVKPEHAWKDDARNYFLNDERTIDCRKFSTNDFMTTRTNIHKYSVNYADKRMIVESEEKGINCLTVCTQRIEYIECTSRIINKKGSWKTIHKNSDKCCIVSRQKDSAVSFDFYGTGVKIFGTRSKEQGSIRLIVDGKLLRTISTRSDICDVLEFMVLDTIDGLSCTHHNLRIELDDDMGVRISGFEIIGGKNVDNDAYVYVSKGRNYKSLGWGNMCGSTLKYAERKNMYFAIHVEAIENNDR